MDSDGESAGLTLQEFKLLEVLIGNKGVVVKRSDLCEILKEENYTPTQRAIDIRISRIRKKLEDNANDTQFIKTVRNVGYIFTSH